MIRLFLVALAVLLVEDISHAQHAPEDPPEIVEARERIAAGETAFDNEDYETALTEFERAYELIGEHPARFLILYNIARSQERLFRYDEALEYYRRYLDEGGDDAEDREEVQAVLRTLEGMLATIEIRSNVEAAIWIDDRHVGDAPATLHVTAGRHLVELRARGYESEQQEIQLAARTSESMSFELVPLPEPSEGVQPVAFWITAAAGVATAVAGGAVGIRAIRERDRIDARLADPIRRFEVTEGDRARITSLTRTADTLYAVAGALGITAIVLGVVADWNDDDDEEAVDVSGFFGPNTAGVVVRGRL